MKLSVSSAVSRMPPSKGIVRETNYLRYLDLPEKWVAEPSWHQTPEVIGVRAIMLCHSWSHFCCRKPVTFSISSAESELLSVSGRR